MGKILKTVLCGFMTLVCGLTLATNLPADFTDGNILTAAELNQWKAEREGSLLPVSANSLSYEDNRHDLGSGTYRWRDAYLGGTIRLSGDIYATGILYGHSNTVFGSGAMGSFTGGGISTGGVLEYVDFTLTGNLTINATEKLLVLLVKGTLRISADSLSAPTINISGVGSGASGGAGTESAANGGDGSAGYLLGGSGGGGGGSGSVYTGGLGGGLTAMHQVLVGGAAGAVSGAGGAGVSMNNTFCKLMKYSRLIGFGAGGGGGGGVGGGGGSGGGGNGGGGLLIIANNVQIVTTVNISCAGAKGNDYYTAANMGGGGGGGGGSIVFFYRKLTGTMPALTVSGGASGDGHSTFDGGIGGAGYSVSEQI